MADKANTIRIKRGWMRVATIVGVTALVLAPVAALASHQFTDVPDSHTFHADISWLADNAITLGCNPPANDQYCPSDAVNRGQMAAFMHRLADNQVVDADKVDGLNASDLTRATGGGAYVNEVAANSPVSNSSVLTLEAPVAGGVVANLEFGCSSFSGSTNTAWIIYPTVDGVAATAMATVVFFPHADLSTQPYSAAGSTAFAAVSAGSHSLGYVATLYTGNGSLDCDINMTAVFTPYDGSGATPSSVSSSGTIGGGLEGE